jgi:fission 1 protein
MAASITNTADPLRQREKLYLLAVGYYRSGDYSRSRDLVETCLEVWFSLIGLTVTWLSREISELRFPPL